MTCVPTVFLVPSSTTPIYAAARQQTDEVGDGHISLGPCTWVLNKKCPDANIKFFLYTRKNVKDRQLVHVDETWESSNISASFFDANDPIKIIIHGYNSDMFLQPLIDMKDGNRKKINSLLVKCLNLNLSFKNICNVEVIICSMWTGVTWLLHLAT